jgi:putative RecB family exonuclease
MTALLFESGVETPDTRAPPQPSQAAPPRDYLSFSSIRTYQQCPLRYYFRYVAGMPEETISVALVFGSAIHRAIEHHFRVLLETSCFPSQEELLAEYQAGWKGHSVPIRFRQGQHARSFDELAARMISAFSQSQLARPAGRILAIEETLRAEIIPGLPELLGRIDLIWETKDELVITDWKSARARYSQDQIDEAAPQLLLYGELAQDIAPGKRVRLQLGVLTKTKDTSIDTHSFPFDQRQLDRTKRIVERVWHAITAEHFFPAPSQMNCPGCPYRDPCRKWPA